MHTESGQPVTYWYHPESECVWIHNPETDGPLESSMGDGLSAQLENEYEYVKKAIQLIDEDPEHKLPEGISGVIKLAKTMAGNLNGTIHYDSRKRFPDGYVVNLTVANKEPGGIYITPSGSKYLCEVIVNG